MNGLPANIYSWGIHNHGSVLLKRLENEKFEELKKILLEI